MPNVSNFPPSVFADDVNSMSGFFLEDKPKYDQFRLDPLAVVMEIQDAHRKPEDPGAEFYKLFHDRDIAMAHDYNDPFSDYNTCKFSPSVLRTEQASKPYLELSETIRKHFQSEMSMRKLNGMHFTQWQSDLLVLLEDLRSKRVNHEHAGMLVSLRGLYEHDLKLDKIYSEHESWQTPDDHQDRIVQATVKQWLDCPQKSTKSFAKAACTTAQGELVIIQVSKPHDQVWMKLLGHESTFTFRAGVIARNNSGFRFMKIINPRFAD